MARRNPHRLAKSTGRLEDMQAVIEEHGGGEVIFEAALIFNGSDKAMLAVNWPGGDQLTAETRASIAMNMMELLATSVADQTSVRRLQRRFHRLGRQIRRLGWLHDRIAPR